jgi:hypothetical protein
VCQFWIGLWGPSSALIELEGSSNFEIDGARAIGGRSDRLFGTTALLDFLARPLFEGRGGRVVPDALQIRVAPRRPLLNPRARGAAWCCGGPLRAQMSIENQRCAERDGDRNHVPMTCDLTLHVSLRAARSTASPEQHFDERVDPTGKSVGIVGFEPDLNPQ